MKEPRVRQRVFIGKIDWFRNIIVSLNGLHGLVRMLSRSDAFCRTISKAVYTELSMAESFKDKAVQSGYWVGELSRHIEGVYLTLCLRRTESCKFIIKVSNIATVDFTGVIYITNLNDPASQS